MFKITLNSHLKQEENINQYLIFWYEDLLKKRLLFEILTDKETVLTSKMILITL